MTARQVYEHVLTELNKVNAPSLLLQDFNYFFNKAVNLYINKQYTIYDTSLQTADDIRVLKATTILKPNTNNNLYENTELNLKNLYGNIAEVTLPKDYLHLLNCICIFKINKKFKCYEEGSNIQFVAKRLTADSWGMIMNDYYNKPAPLRPYYYIHNINTLTSLPTNPNDLNLGTDLWDIYNTTDSSIDIEETKKNLIQEFINTDTNVTFIYKDDSVINYPSSLNIDSIDWDKTISNTNNLNYVVNKNTTISNFERTVTLGTKTVSTVNKPIAIRYSNPSTIRMEIRYGNDKSVFELEEVMIDYLKSPLYIELTPEQVDLVKDTSLILEFPDYVCQEIINELVMLILENNSDPRIQTQIPVSLSIVSPLTQVLTQ